MKCMYLTGIRECPHPETHKDGVFSTVEYAISWCTNCLIAQLIAQLVRELKLLRATGIQT